MKDGLYLFKVINNVVYPVDLSASQVNTFNSFKVAFCQFGKAKISHLENKAIGKMPELNGILSYSQDGIITKNNIDKKEEIKDNSSIVENIEENNNDSILVNKINQIYDSLIDDASEFTKAYDKYVNENKQELGKLIEATLQKIRQNNQKIDIEYLEKLEKWNDEIAEKNEPKKFKSMYIFTYFTENFDSLQKLINN